MAADPYALEARHQARLAAERKAIIDKIEDELDAKYTGIGKPVSFSAENEMHTPELLDGILKSYVTAGWTVKHERCSDQREKVGYTSFTFTFNGRKRS